MTQATNPAPKLDIFRVLGAANKKNREFLDTLTPEEVKAFQPFLVMRWMTGTDSARQVFFTNEFVNPFAFSLSGSHKQLLWQLLTIANAGQNQKYTWVKLPAKTTTSKPTSVGVLKRMYNYSTDECNDALKILGVDDILELATDLGLQPDDISKINKEWKPKK
jgi:hypothetical protein